MSFTFIANAPAEGTTQVKNRRQRREEFRLETRLSRKSRAAKQTFRIGMAAVGRIMTMVMEHLSVLLPDPAVYVATVKAIYGYIQNPEYIPDDDVDTDAYNYFKAEIDKSAHRSLMARQRALARKSAMVSAVTVPAPTEAKCIDTPEPQSSVTTEDASMCTYNEPAPVKPPIERDPEMIYANYRPKKRIPRCYVSEG